MSYNDKQKQALRTELALSVYLSLTDAQVADSLLAKTKNQNRISMTRQEVYEKIDPVALAGLTTVQLAQINLTLSDTIDPFGNAVEVFKSVFGAGSTTVTALAGARKRKVSRLTELGLGDIEKISLIGWINTIRST